MTEATLKRLGIDHPDHLEPIWREILKLRLKADIQEMKEIEMSSTFWSGNFYKGKLIYSLSHHLLQNDDDGFIVCR